MSGYGQAIVAHRSASADQLFQQEMVMAVYVDLEMSTETALKLLEFIRQKDGSESDLSSLFAEIERQVQNSIEYESQYVQGTLHKKPTN